MKTKRLVVRCLVYLCGLMLIGFGVSISVNANLGMAPNSSLYYAVFSALAHNGIHTLTLGNIMSLVFIALLLAQIAVMRRDFKWFNLLQIPVSIVGGLLLDVAQWIVGDFVLPGYIGRLIMVAMTAVLVAAGVLFFLAAKFVPMPPEGLYMAIITANLTRLPLHRVKIIGDTMFVVVAALVSFLATGQIAGIREATIILAVGVGAVMGLMGRRLSPLLEYICFGKKAAEEIPEAEPVGTLPVHLSAEAEVAD